MTLALALVSGSVNPAFAAIIYDALEDEDYEVVYEGGGANESLASIVSNYRDPYTGDINPILSPGGRPLVVGSEALGEDPFASDQSQVQRFYVSDYEEEITIRYLGLGGAGFKSVFGAYYYSSVAAHEEITYEPLFVQNVTEIGTEQTFRVPADSYFGFYLDANGHTSSRGRWYTENERNDDNADGVISDHFLMFNTNRGILLAIEDLPLAQNGRLGDQDYEDLLVGFITKSNGERIEMPPTRVVPEATAALQMTLLLIGSVVGPLQRNCTPVCNFGS